MEGKITVECYCPFCGKLNEVVVYFEDYCTWQFEGGRVQDVFPYLTPSEREYLISGICDECWGDI